MEKVTSIATLIKCITNEYEKQFNQLLTTSGITASQFAVLNYLYETNKEYVNQKDIESYLNLSNPTVTGLLKRLDEKGYLLVVQNVQDKRKKNVYLTEQAYDMKKRFDASRKKMDRALFRGMKKNEVECLRRYLERVLYNIED
ncbi:MAG: MarR family transcriptional regulator [Eubacteriales bacterium]